VHAKDRGRYRQLAELGQAPTAMVIACCDARVDVSAIFDTEPGALFVRDGSHPDGHPLRPLLWLANHLAAQGTGLSAGDVVTTGSYCGMLDVPLDTPLVVGFSDFARLSIQFVPK
jgi:hypothetical protein